MPKKSMKLEIYFPKILKLLYKGILKLITKSNTITQRRIDTIILKNNTTNEKEKIDSLFIDLFLYYPKIVIFMV